MASSLNRSWLDRTCGSFFDMGPLFTEAMYAMFLVLLSMLCP